MIRLRERAELIPEAAQWFHERWGVPQADYLESMRACAAGDDLVPQWYLEMEGGRIIAGAGVIQQDFHLRPDLTPNVCALYVEPAYRGRGIARALLEAICGEFRQRGVDTLYLVTDHTSFYERYGWDFFGMVPEEGGNSTIRMYRHRA